MSEHSAARASNFCLRKFKKTFSPVSSSRWKDGEMERWRDGEMGVHKIAKTRCVSNGGMPTNHCIEGLVGSCLRLLCGTVVVVVCKKVLPKKIGKPI